MTASSTADGVRRSLGGRVVEDSLARVGFRLDPRVQIVETARPQLRGGATVLVQNAWNFLDEEEFAELSRPYPRAMQRRMVQRRALAALNVRRAARVVALTAAMADLVTARTGRTVTLAPVAYPLDVLDDADADDATGLPDAPFVLLPGTITWYKDPLTGLALVAARADLPDRVLLAGPDDGSGCWADVRRVAAALGLEVSATALGRPAMLTALRRARAVVVPSRLESLGFSVSEALALAPGEVVASPLAAHRELAAGLGRTPTWIGEPAPTAPVPGTPVTPDAERLHDSWVALGTSLGLPRTTTPTSTSTTTPTSTTERPEPTR